LNAYHSFSFASWYNPERVQFGALRVLNDDTVAAGMGFGTHRQHKSSPFHLKEIWRTKTAWEYRNHPKWRCAGVLELGEAHRNSIKQRPTN
jgi:redox-sensitive bicupin YhaK (pirin superfamily)